MAVTDYITVDGMILGEVTNGVMRNYGTDALGSVVATYTGGALENAYRYKPYGGLLVKTGTASDPKFLWNGGSGYRSTTLAESDYYVRRRHISTTSGQWTTCDLLWPKERPYGNVNGRPVLVNDRSGNGVASNSSPLCGCCPISISQVPVKCTSDPATYTQYAPCAGQPPVSPGYEKAVYFGFNITISLCFQLESSFHTPCGWDGHESVWAISGSGSNKSRTGPATDPFGDLGDSITAGALNYCYLGSSSGSFCNRSICCSGVDPL